MVRQEGPKEVAQWPLERGGFTPSSSVPTAAALVRPATVSASKGDVGRIVSGW